MGSSGISSHVRTETARSLICWRIRRSSYRIACCRSPRRRGIHGRWVGRVGARNTSATWASGVTKLPSCATIQASRSHVRTSGSFASKPGSFLAPPAARYCLGCRPTSQAERRTSPEPRTSNLPSKLLANRMGSRALRCSRTTPRRSTTGGGTRRHGFANSFRASPARFLRITNHGSRVTISGVSSPSRLRMSASRESS